MNRQDIAYYNANSARSSKKLWLITLGTEQTCISIERAYCLLQWDTEERLIWISLVLHWNTNLSRVPHYSNLCPQDIYPGVFIYPPSPPRLALLSPRHGALFCCVSTSLHNISLLKCTPLLTFKSSPWLRNGWCSYHISALIGLKPQSQFGRLVWERVPLRHC